MEGWMDGWRVDESVKDEWMDNLMNWSLELQ